MTRALRLPVAAFAALLLGSLGLVPPPASGHALQPAYLELRELGDGLYAVLWKKPAVAGGPMAIDARLPARCDPATAEQPLWDGAAWIARWTASCPGGLAGGRIVIEGLERTSTDVLVRLDYADGVSDARRLTPGEPALLVPARAGTLEVAHTYLVYGVEHILLGIDHLLFVLALLLLVRGASRVVATVTAFTVAHSVTLAGATLGWVHVPGPPVEATIALSIAFVAAEILHGRRGRPGLTERWPWLIAFAFGLLHGFGFAGALTEVGLPQGSIPTALLFFNLGVEAGQLLFIAAALPALAVGRRIAATSAPRWAPAVLPCAIGSLAMFWAVQRTVAFLP